MITKAKVSKASVKTFDQVVIEARDFSDKFNKGISCIEQLLKCLTDLQNQVSEKIKEMRSTQEKLAVKIRNIEEIVARLTVRLNELQERMTRLEGELLSTSSTISSIDENGETHEYPNPAYEALEAEISALQGEISVVEDELYPHEQRLDRAHSVDSQISSQIDNANSTVYSLSEKISTCKQLIIELEDVKNSNSKKSTYTVENLKRIMKLIDSYLLIKMKYNPVGNITGGGSSQNRNDINVNVNINKSSAVNEPQKEIQKLSQEDIERHQIKFDADNHICEYEGRKYGCKYHSYQECIDGTSKENPILGYYEGERGESKYIPSNRSVEGIVVINILKQRGLDGIIYRNAEPEFEVCAEAVVKISGMTYHRSNYTDENGLNQLGNFTQADIGLAKTWNLEEKDNRKDWSAREVLEYRKANGLTWHEKCDTETMVLVKTEINSFFKHVGGCSECGRRDGVADDGDFYEE